MNDAQKIDRRMVQIAAAPRQRLESYKGSTSRLSRLMDEMSRASGFMTTERSPKGRKHWWVLTEAGVAELPKARERHAALIEANAKAQREHEAAERMTILRHDASAELLAVCIATERHCRVTTPATRGNPQAHAEEGRKLRQRMQVAIMTATGKSLDEAIK